MAGVLARASLPAGQVCLSLWPLTQAFSWTCREASTSANGGADAASSSTEPGCTGTSVLGHERNSVVSRLLRESHAAEVAAQGFFQGQKLVYGGRRSDISHFQDQELQALDQTRQLLPRHRARPSLLQGALKWGGVATGMAAALAPRPVQLAIWGAVSEAMEEHYTDTLRELLQAAAENGLDPKQVPELREVLVRLRDVSRAPEGAPPAPDILLLQHPEKIKELGLSGAAAVIVKAASKVALSAAGKL